MSIHDGVLLTCNHQKVSGFCVLSRGSVPNLQVEMAVDHHAMVTYVKWKVPPGNSTMGTDGLSELKPVKFFFKAPDTFSHTADRAYFRVDDNPQC